MIHTTGDSSSGSISHDATRVDLGIRTNSTYPHLHISLHLTVFYHGIARTIDPHHHTGSRSGLDTMFTWMLLTLTVSPVGAYTA